MPTSNMPFEIRFITSLLGGHVYIAASEQGVKDETRQICAELSRWRRNGRF